MFKKCLLSFLIVFFSLSSQALNEGSQTVTLDGVLFQKGTTTPLQDSNVLLKIQIINPSGTCLLYEETQTVNTATTKGHFNISVGSALSNVKRTVNDPGNLMAKVFQNVAAIPAASVPGQTCAGASYVPTAGDVRYFRITVTPSATNLADTLAPDILMDSVPQALVAQSVQGLERANILAANSAAGISLSQNNLESLFTGTAWTNLQSILAGNFLRTDSSGATLPSYAATPAGVSIGDMWYDSVTNQIKYQTNTGTQTVGSTSITGDAITSGTISGSAGINSSGNLITSGNISGATINAGVVTGATLTGSNVQATNLRVYNGSQYVQLTAQPMSASINLALPTSVGVSGQVLSTNGSGVMSWINAPGIAGTVSIGQGGTNAVSFTANRIIASNGTGSALQDFSCSLNQVISFDVTGAAQCSNVASLGNFIVNGGNSTGSAISIGSNDNVALNFKTNNSIAMTISENGRVGIGTTSPTYNLEVIGDGKFSNSLSVNGDIGSGLIKAYIRSDSQSSYQTMMLDDAQFGANSHAEVIFATGGGYNAMVRGGRDGSNLPYLSLATGAPTPTERLRINSNGNVGIGTTNPSGVFEVQGGTSTAGTGADIKLYAQHARVDGGSYPGGNVVIQAGKGRENNAGGTVAIVAGDQQSSGASAVGASMYLYGGQYGGPGGGVVISAGAGNNGKGDGGKIYLNSNGSSGFGGTMTFQGGNSNTGGAIDILGGNAWNCCASPFASGGNVNIQGGTGLGGGPGGNVILAASRGNVGIGNSSPSSALDMNGAITARGMSSAPTVSPANQGRIYFDYATNKFKVSENGAAYTDLMSSANSFVNGGNSFAADAALGTNDNFSLSFKTNNTTAMTISNNGYVGIGTSAPTSKLHISSTNTNYGMQMFHTAPGGSYGYGIYSLESGGATNNVAMYGEASGHGVGVYGWASGQNGYYGVGVVGESAGTANAIGVKGVANGSSNVGYAVQAINNSASGWGVYSSGSSPNYFAGNVGIGISTPSAKLEVAGEIKVGNSASTCNSSTEGQFRYNSTEKLMEFCNGTDWKLMVATIATASDQTPDAFSFTDLTDQSLGALVLSNTLSITGINGPTLVSVSGSGSPQISINGGGWVTAGTITAGQTLRVRQLTPNAVTSSYVAAVTVGDTTDNWSVTTRAGQLRMFLTSGVYSGNLGGVSGADAICQSEAGVKGYSGTWKAIVSTSTSNAKDRLTIVYPVVNAASTSTVIESTNLWAGSLENSLASGYSYNVWTGSNTLGDFSSAGACNDWTSNSGGVNGRIGTTFYSNSTFLDYQTQGCSNALFLYCIEQ